MKIGQLLIASTAAAISYWTVANKDKILKETKETTALVNDLSAHYTNIQQQLQIIKDYEQPLREMVEDLQYKIRVYQQEATGHVKEITPLLEKYQSKE
ncbi:MAG: hypothetical protein SOS23_06975 [Streptococcus hyovaginalis]|nr:hypothetical protein [Streptococcus hyovaginalis]